MKRKVDPNYQDRGMMKWQGFILHEMAAELEDAEELVRNELSHGDILDEDFWEDDSFIEGKD